MKYRFTIAADLNMQRLDVLDEREILSMDPKEWSIEDFFTAQALGAFRQTFPATFKIEELPG